MDLNLNSRPTDPNTHTINLWSFLPLERNNHPLETIKWAFWAVNSVLLRLVDMNQLLSYIDRNRSLNTRGPNVISAQKWPSLFLSHFSGSSTAPLQWLTLIMFLKINKYKVQISTNSRAKFPGLYPHLPAVWPWTGYLILNLLVYKMEILFGPAS